MASLEKLKEHLQKAHIIIDERDLYGIWDYVPKSHDPEFRGDSFNQAVKQVWEPRVYQDWEENLEDLFLVNNLDFIKFKRVTISGDARKTSSLPAAIFVKRVIELERIFEYPTVLESYKTTNKQPASWPKVTFQNSTITQGARQHNFSQPALTKLVAVLWAGRRIITPSGTVLEPGKPMKRDKVNKLAGIKSHDRFIGISNGVRRAMKKKGIELVILYPDQVILLVKQSRK